MRRKLERRFFNCERSITDFAPLSPLFTIGKHQTTEVVGQNFTSGVKSSDKPQNM